MLKKYPIHIFGIFVTLVFTIYYPALQGDFIWDDDNHVLAVYDENTINGLKKIWFEPGAFNQYYPLTYSSFWLENKFWNLNTQGYHAVNLILHSCVGFLLFLVLRILAIPYAFWATILFLIHPIQTESVAWVTERKNVLSGSFYFCSAWFYLQFSGFARTYQGENKKRSTPILYCASLLCFVLALWSKTVVVTLPCAILLIHYWKESTLNKQAILNMIPFFIIGVILSWVPAQMEREHILIRCGVDCQFSPVERFLIAGGTFWFYIWKFFSPINLTFIYPRWQISIDDLALYLLPASAIGLMILLWLMRNIWGRGPLTAVLFYSGTLFPAMGFLSYYPIRYSFVADHFQYFANIGLIALTTAGTHKLIKYSRTNGFKFGQSALTGLAALILIALATLTWQQAHAYKDEETLYRHIIKKNPNSWMPLYNLGIIYLEKKQPRKALEFLNRAAKSKPEFAGIHNNLGIALASLNRKEDAISKFQIALDLDPKLSQARINLAALWVEKGKNIKALNNLQIVLQSEPKNKNALVILANLHLNNNDFLKAAKYYGEALPAKRDDPYLHYNLGLAFLGLRKMEMSKKHFKIALVLRPEWKAAKEKLLEIASGN